MISRKPRTVAIIQARMGSTRLPGKVLRPVAGRPLLWHIVHRLKAARRIDNIAIATTTNPLDEAIVEFGRVEGVTVIRGPEDNVLARFAQAAEQLGADIIVRVSSDAPFIDAGFVDHLIASLIDQDGDYVLMEEGTACAHEGVDPFSRRALDKLMMDAADDAAAREHVTGYFKLHPDFVRIVRAKPYISLARKGGRLTIDTPDDLAFAEAVHARLAAKAGEASLADLLLLLEREPALSAINRHVRQKPVVPAGGLALIRCDGGGKFGYGHVKRMVALGRALRDCQSIGVLFALHGTEDAAEPIRRAGFELTMLEDEAALATLVSARQPDILILDGREGPSRAALEAMRSTIPVVAGIDDGAERRLACDFAYYPPVPQLDKMDWTAARTVPRIGWQWALTGLNPHLMPVRTADFAPPGDAGCRPPRPTLLVAMGGSDPFGLTYRAAEALAGLDSSVRVRFVIGAGQAAGVAAAIAAMKDNYETVEGAEDLSIEYAGADLALCAFGVTAYELASFGVPAVYLALSEDHARSASAFVLAGMGLCLGLPDQLSDEQIIGPVRELLADPARRRQMRVQGLCHMDGHGAVRIAADLAAALAEERAMKARHSRKG
jgi:spore coat polysaccharide biosynthesis protein SpsF